jgi:hypothetical protein
MNFLSPLSALGSGGDKEDKDKAKKSSTQKLGQFESVDEEQNSKADNTVNKGSRDSSMI